MTEYTSTHSHTYHIYHHVISSIISSSSIPCPEFALLRKLVWYVKCEECCSTRTNTPKYSNSASPQEPVLQNIQALLLHKNWHFQIFKHCCPTKNQHLQNNVKNLSMSKGFFCMRTCKSISMGGCWASNMPIFPPYNITIHNLILLFYLVHTFNFKRLQRKLNDDSNQFLYATWFKTPKFKILQKTELSF